MNKPRHLAVLTLLSWVPLLASANDAALAQCRALADAPARLACYDRIPLAGVAAPATAPASAAAAVVPKAASVAAAVAAGPAAAPMAAAPAARPPAQPAPDATAAMGLPQRAEPPSQMSSSIAGLFEGWSPRERIRLANGQVWEVADGSRAAYRLQNPAVTVRRTAFGGFEMDIEGVNQRLRVRRVAE